MANESEFRLQIVHVPSKFAVVMRPNGPLEKSLAPELTSRLKKRGVGMFVSEATVLKAVEEELAVLIWDLKSEV